MSTSPLYTALTNYSKKQYSSFHTPGHKCARFFPDDLLSLDLTELPDVQAGDEAEIFGARADLNALSRAAQTIPYELLCSVSKRVPRVWKDFD